MHPWYDTRHKERGKIANTLVLIAHVLVHYRTIVLSPYGHWDDHILFEVYGQLSPRCSSKYKPVSGILGNFFMPLQQYIRMFGGHCDLRQAPAFPSWRFSPFLEFSPSVHKRLKALRTINRSIANASWLWDNNSRCPLKYTEYL